MKKSTKDLAMKPSNPKDMIGSSKVPMHLWPTTATIMGSMALLEGALKYGRSNFRRIGVRASIYFDALIRHSFAWFEGEECDPDSGLPHLCHALACLAIIVDADAAGKLTDDRMTPGGYRPLIDKMTEHVRRLKEKYADRSPKHYTINDTDLTMEQQGEFAKAVFIEMKRASDVAPRKTRKRVRRV